MRVIFWLALVLGLLVRIAVLTETGGLGTPIVDEQHYTQLATNLLDGNGFAWGSGQLTSIRPPLYPALIASIWSMTGAGNLQAIRIVQILLALVTVGLVYQLGVRTFGQRVGYLSAALFWLYPSLVYFNFTILTETLFTLLLIGFVLSAVVLVQAPRAWSAVICGVVLGAAALVRSVLWPLPLLLCPILFMILPGSLKVRMALSALVLVGFVAVVGPWAVRNTRLQSGLTIVDTMGGINLRLGNYEHTPEDRMWATVDLMKGEKEWSYALTSQHPGQQFNEGQKDKWAQRAALEYMRANVGTTARRALIKFADFWGIEREFIASVQYGALSPPGWFAMAVAALIVLAYVGVVMAGVVGMWLAAPQRREHILLLLPIVVTTAIHTIVYGHSRYHIPLMPLFGIYSAALLGRLWPSKASSSSAAAGVSTLWPPAGIAWYGAAVSVVVLIVIWLRQFVFADADRIRALFSNGG